MSSVLDVQRLRLLPEPSDPVIDCELDCDLLIAGGGTGGCAAALAACRAGRTVVLTEETDWLGGQMTSQGVSALDENRFIESFSGTRTYYELRDLIRTFYLTRTELTPAAARVAALNPGNGWVSDLCFEPRAAVWALDQLLAPFLSSGRLTLLLRHKAVSAEVEADTISSVVFRRLDGSEHVSVRAGFVLDATELGDLLPLTGTEYVSGAESILETGETGAGTNAAPECVQSFTYPFAVELRPGERHYVRRPESYETNSTRQPYTLRHLYHDERGWLTYRMFERGERDVPPFWTYRRLIDAAQFDDPSFPNDIAMINWPGNDFRHGNLIDVEPEAALEALREAKELSLGFCHWLEAECPRDDGGAGYPEMLLRPDVMGTPDGLSKYPYIRESRRIRAVRTILEQDIAAAHQRGARAALVPDSVGVGLYAIDIHPSEGEAKIPPAAVKPFQIPMSALIPVRMRNLLPAAKNIGTTHITNGAYRLHPIEWNIGEAAAHLAGFCMDRNLTPQTLVTDARRRRRLQRKLVRAGIPLHWYTDLPLDHELFEPAQVLAAWGFWTGNEKSLEFQPHALLGSAELRALTTGAGQDRERLEPLISGWLARWSTLERGDALSAAYAALSV
ncbi:MAG: FAD-dependent oxidoreductase [Actinomycetota bacterium]